MHQSRISDSLGFDFTEDFTVEGQRLAPPGIMDVVDRRRSSILLGGEAGGLDLIGGSRSVMGHASGASIDSQDTLAFSALSGVRPTIETMPLERAGRL